MLQKIKLLFLLKMKLTRFNTFFPLLFITSEFIIIYLVTKLMHYLTFADWTIYNTLIIIFGLFFQYILRLLILEEVLVI